MWAELRYRTVHRLLTSAESDRIPLLDGRLGMLVAVTVLGGGAACLAVVIALAVQ